MRGRAIASDHSVASAARRHHDRQQTAAHAAACSTERKRQPHAVSSKAGPVERCTFDDGAAQAFGRALSWPEPP